VFYAIAALGHLFALETFVQTGATIMAVFNIFSVSLFIAALFLLKKGYYRTAYWGAILELTSHGILATICVGPDYGFTAYPFLVTILLFIQPFYTWRFSLLVAALILTSAVVTWPIYVLIMVLPFIRASARAEKELAAAYAESERLLLNILPEPIARRLKATAGMITDDRDHVAILFADIVGFTSMSGRLRAAEVVTLLNEVFNAIDELVVQYGAEKIKTIGDAYMVVAGLPEPVKDPEETIARLALDIQRVASQFRIPDTGEPVALRIGINTGQVVAGVIGNRKFAYDLWGDAVNVAARVEATGEPGRIQVTDAFADTLRDRFEFEPRGEIEVKGKGMIATSFLVGELP